LIESEKEPERTRPGAFWLIVQDDGDRPKVFELGAGRGEKSLPIFSFEEEALLFLRLGGLEGLWRASETDAAELASALTRTCSGVQHVVLDPFPEIGFEALFESVNLRWERFIDLFAIPASPPDYRQIPT
jgi:hypothetical protein